MIIRRATDTDVPGITEIYNEAVLETTATFDLETRSEEDRLQWFRSHDERHPIIVADVDGRIAGWASLTEWNFRKAYDGSVESSVYVLSEFQGQGIGRNLQKKIMDEARELGYRTIIAQATDENEISIKLHQDFGFHDVGILRRVGEKFGRLLDVRILQIMLD